MSKRCKYTAMQKSFILRELANGKSVGTICKEYDINRSTLRSWQVKYEWNGVKELEEKHTWTNYSEELKEQVVEEYVSNRGGLKSLCKKYGISSTQTLRNWISKYNNGTRLRSTPEGKSKEMRDGRKTTYEERLEIVRHCDTHDNNYQETADLYQVSYQQVYSWMRKYKECGEKALIDRRGKAKEEAKLTELDRLKIENRRLLNENRKLEVENAFLKKLEELEKRYR